MYDFQKANMWKRISAFLLDFIVMSIVVVGTAALLSFALNYRAQIDKLDKLYADYNIEFSENGEELTEEQQKQLEEASKQLVADPEYGRVVATIINYTMIMVSFSILTGYLVVEFLFPTIFKNGQTLGKKIFGIGVMRVDGVKISPEVLFVRTILGKYTVETMLPVLILGMFLFEFLGIIKTGFLFLGLGFLLALIIAQFVLLVFTKTHAPLHDKLAHTVTVDLTSQIIFDSVEDMVAYKKRIHDEQSESENT